MNGPGDIPLINSNGTPDLKTCSLTSIIPALGMSSCRGRAEAFARSLSSKLRTLGSQTDDDAISQEEDEPITNCVNTADTWRTSNDAEQPVTDLQPLRHESDSFFDFDCEIESPGSPADECEYLRLIETASNTPHNSAAESGYVCASAASSQGSSDVPYFGHINEDVANDHSQTHPTPHLTESQETNKTLNKKEDDPTETANDNEENCVDDIDGPSDISQLENDECINELQAETILQDEIISELQQHSDRIGNIIDSITSQTISEIRKETEAYENHEMDSIAVVSASNALPKDNSNILISSKTSEEENCETNKLTLDTSKSDDSSEKISETDQSEKNAQRSELDATDEDDEDCRPQRVRRCSSLKTGKTPPGTPGRKKIVRFADVLGLDLADIKTFLDEIPTIPKSAFEDLEVMDSEPPIQLGPKSNKLLMPLFQQPGGLPNFLDFVREKQVSLENAAVTDHISQTITGTVRVRNLDFHKSVHIRYSLDNWRSFADLQANYAENSCDGFSDKFSFVLFGNTLQIGQRLEFAVRFQCKGQQFWDNNYGTNYCFQCLPATPPINNSIHTIVTHSNSHVIAPISPTVGDTWCSAFY